MNIPTFEKFSVDDSSTVGPRWRKYLARYEFLISAMGIGNQSARKRALLLHYAGEQVFDIYETFSDAQKGEETEEGYQTLKQSLTDYFVPKKNVDYETFVFRQARQEVGETTDQFCTRLRKLASTCEFANIEREIKGQILQGCTSNRLRRRGLRDDLSLTDLLQQARSLELADYRASEMEREHTNALKTNYSAKQPPKHTHEYKKCGWCGGQRHRRQECPAYGHECQNCHKQNHYSSVCRQPKQTEDMKTSQRFPRSHKHKVRQVVEEQNNDSQSNSDEEEVFTINGEKKIPTVKVKLFDTETEFLVDSGATVNVIHISTKNRICPKLKLLQPCQKIQAYGTTDPLPIAGYFDAEVCFKGKKATDRFYVISCEKTTTNLLSARTAQALGLVQFAFTIHMPNETDGPRHPADDFPELFDGGLGKIKNVKVKLHVDETVKPVSQRVRRVPFHIRKSVEQELKRLEEMDIIEKVSGEATPWVSPIVTVPKRQGGVRLCVDTREANKAIARENHPMPTLDDLITDLNQSTVFSKLDLTKAYHQLELEESSKSITTFVTHTGLYRYKRLLFGVNAASEIFQKTIADILSDIKGAKNLSDDIIVHGKTQADHDAALKATLKCLHDNEAKLNKEKCVFSTNRLVFFGHIFGDKGISVDPEKVTLIQNTEAPKNVSEVRSFLGMTQYVSRFIPGYAIKTEPLRALTKKDAPWKWTRKEAEAFEKLKQALSDTPVMAYFDSTQDTKVIVDASPVGIGAILTQNDRVISYASRALTPTEQRYSQTDREFLAVVYGIEHFHLYLYGSEFTVVTDHKPLLGIINSQKPTTARMERWRLRIMPYQMTLQYKPGRNDLNPADYISRHPQTIPTRNNKAEDYISFITSKAVPKSMTLDEIRAATAMDTTLVTVMEAVQTGRWDKPELSSFARFASEISVTDGVVLRGHRIIIPNSLQKRVISIAHQAHQGIVKTKQCIREKVWFPGIDSMVEETIKACIPCQASNPQTPNREPIQPTPLPSEPWTCLSMDFSGPFPSGDYLLIVVDDYSRFPEVEIVKSTSASSVIPKLENIFARQGFPTTVKTDNGPPFTSHEFAEFAESCGFKHRKITPLHPEANGEAERFVKTLNRTVRAAIAENKNWKANLPTFLRMYRATPHTATKTSPFEALTGRKMKFGLPNLPPISPSLQHPEVIHTRLTLNDNKAKQKMAAYADDRRNTKPLGLLPGSQVLVKQKKVTKLTPPFSPHPYQVVERKGSMITARRGDHEITRNSTYFKPVQDVLSPDLHADSSASDTESDAEPEPEPAMPNMPALTPYPVVPSTPASMPVAHSPSVPCPETTSPAPAHNTRSTKGHTAQRPMRYR